MGFFIMLPLKPQHPNPSESVSGLDMRLGGKHRGFGRRNRCFSSGCNCFISCVRQGTLARQSWIARQVPLICFFLLTSQPVFLIFDPSESEFLSNLSERFESHRAVTEIVTFRNERGITPHLHNPLSENRFGFTIRETALQVPKQNYQEVQNGGNQA